MSYDDKATRAIAFEIGMAMALVAKDAIPPLTLKTEDGRFVKVKQEWRLHSDGGYDRCYLVVEDPS